MCQTLMFALAVLSQMQPETSAAPFQEKPGFLLAVVGTALGVQKIPAGKQMERQNLPLTLQPSRGIDTEFGADKLWLSSGVGLS